MSRNLKRNLKCLNLKLEILHQHKIKFALCILDAFCLKIDFNI